MILAGLPSDHTVWTRIREDACAFLLRKGYLAKAELGTLSVTEATLAALQRLRGSQLDEFDGTELMLLAAGEEWERTRPIEHNLLIALPFYADVV